MVLWFLPAEELPKLSPIYFTSWFVLQLPLLRVKQTMAVHNWNSWTEPWSSLALWFPWVHPKCVWRQRSDAHGVKMMNWCNSQSLELGKGSQSQKVSDLGNATVRVLGMVWLGSFLNRYTAGALCCAEIQSSLKIYHFGRENQKQKVTKSHG